MDALDGRRKYCQCKAGPQTINNDDVTTILGHFKKLMGKARIDHLKLNFDDLIVGVLYGDKLSSNYKIIASTYPVYAGVDFWEHLTGDRNFYYRLSKVFGEVVEEDNIDGSKLILDKVKELNVFEFAMRAKQLDVLVELLIYWSEKSTSDFWKNYIGEVDHNLASLFVNWYTKQENEVLTLHGIRLKDSNEEKILSDQELLERFAEFLKTKPNVIPGEYIEKIKACLEQKNDIEQKKDSKSSKKEQKLNIQPQQSSKNKAIQEDSIYTLLALMNGESPTKTSQQKSKKSKKEIKSTNKEEEIISSKPRIESFFTVFSLTASQGSKKVDVALFKKGMEAINAAIMALNTSGIPFGLKQNGTNHYQLRLDGELPAFAIECFNTHAKPDVISIPHGGNKVWSDHFNSMLSYLVHFMCFVIENGKDNGACMTQLFMFNKQGQLNIDLLKDLYPTIEWDKLD